jgi:hypothetical protein
MIIASPENSSEIRPSSSHTEAELPELLLVVKRRQRPSNTKPNSRPRPALRGDQPLRASTEENNAAAQSELGAVILVLLQKVSYRIRSAYQSIGRKTPLLTSGGEAGAESQARDERGLGAGADETEGAAGGH